MGPGVRRAQQNEMRLAPASHRKTTSTKRNQTRSNTKRKTQRNQRKLIDILPAHNSLVAGSSPLPGHHRFRPAGYAWRKPPRGLKDEAVVSGVGLSESGRRTGPPRGAAGKPLPTKNIENTNPMYSSRWAAALADPAQNNLTRRANHRHNSIVAHCLLQRPSDWLCTFDLARTPSSLDRSLASSLFEHDLFGKTGTPTFPNHALGGDIARKTKRQPFNYHHRCKISGRAAGLGPPPLRIHSQQLEVVLGVDSMASPDRAKRGARSARKAGDRRRCPLHTWADRLYVSK